MPDIHNLEAVIFDLGEVILDLDMPATYSAFAHMAGKTVEEVQALAKDQSFFLEHEVGEIDDPTFRANIRELLEIFNSDEEIDAAWNAMIRSIKRERLELVANINSRYQCFVMSNTNEIHFRHITRIGNYLAPGNDFSGLFKQLYLSQEMGVRKPDIACWQPILADHQLDPAKTLFIDDKLENCEGAASLGIQTYHNQHVDDWMGLFLP